MPSLKSIRKRISSVKATQKITRAMKMVAGARLSRAQQRITALRPYAVKTQDILHGVAGSMRAKHEEGEPSGGAIEADVHPLLRARPEQKVLLLVLSGERGLCGAFNTNVSKAAFALHKEKAAGADVSVGSVGKKGRDYLSRRRVTIVKDFPRVYEGLDLDKAKPIADWIVASFEKGEVDSVYLVYNEFKSAIAQKTVVDQLLPLPARAAPSEPLGPTEYMFEPNERSVLDKLLPMYVAMSVYRALLETQAGFFGAQMTAMDAATRNAKDMIARLTLVYNRARQAAITKELMEIIGGAEALKE